MKVESWPKLITSVLLAQSAGLIGSYFTVSAIPTWYIFLNKPFFSPPNWLFGPVWTILYTLIGISFYKIWINTKKENSWAIKFFLFHLFLNSIWSILFFGLKDLRLAFFEIVVMWMTIIYMIYKYKKINKTSSYLLVPYLFWVSFALVLNFSFWKLNPDEGKWNVFAQDLTTQTAFNDFAYARDNYNSSLNTYNLKKDSYLKNKTLSLKEEVRIALYDFLLKRNEYKRTYLTVIRTRVSELTGISTNEKEAVFTKIDPEVVWLDNRKNQIKQSDSLEDLLNKSAEEDSRYETDTLPIIYFSLSNVSLSSVIEIKNSHKTMYEKLRNEAGELVRLGRADESLFDRWFKDIEIQLAEINIIENATRDEIVKIFNQDNYQIKKAYEKVIEKLEPGQQKLLTLNDFVTELESTIQEKR